MNGYLSEDTIAAIATAVGGAITMIRVSGRGAFTALASLSGQDRATAALLPEARKLHRIRLRDAQGAELDDALYARFVAPASYTGEDVIELHLHGGAFIASRVMEALARLGVRQALPGEFSFRAVRNGKLVLSQAQAVADLIAATNDGAVSLALEKLSGTQNRLVVDLAAEVRRIAVLAEAGIDFADQDIEEVSLPRLREQAYAVMNLLRRLQNGYERGSRLQDGIGVAFVGLPNAGKSSYFNALLGEERSIVSDFAGTTRDIVRERITLRGGRSTITLRLEDTAGLRQADHPVERIGIERTQRAARDADLILFLVDPTSKFEAVREQWDLLGRPAEKTLGIFTKIDLLPSSGVGDASHEPLLRQRYRELGLTRWVQVSSTTGTGIQSSVEAITEHCERWTHRDPGEVLLTRLDHLRAVENALDHLERAAQAPEIDLFAADVRQALNSLGPLIGETLPDDILGKIFSDFCIGK